VKFSNRGSVAKNERFVVKAGRLPRSPHTGSLLWPNPKLSLLRLNSHFSLDLNVSLRRAACFRKLSRFGSPLASATETALR
jgi:hypothetical protein